MGKGKGKHKREKKKRGKGPRQCEWCEILAGGKKAVNAFVNSASDMNAKNEQGDTILHVAVFRMHDALKDGSKARYHQAAKMVIYLANYCDINAINNDGFYPADILSDLIDNPATLDSTAQTALEALLSRNIVEGYLSVTKETYSSRSVFMVSYPKCHYKHVITDQDNVNKSNRLPQLIKAEKWSLVRKTIDTGCASNIQVNGMHVFEYAVACAMSDTYKYFPHDILQKLLHPEDIIEIRKRKSKLALEGIAHILVEDNHLEIVPALAQIYDLEYCRGGGRPSNPLYRLHIETNAPDLNPLFLEFLPRGYDLKIVLMEVLCIWLDCPPSNQESAKRIVHQLCSQIRPAVGGCPDLYLRGCKEFEVFIRHRSLDQPPTFNSLTFSQRILSIDNLRILFEILNKHSVLSFRGAFICISGNSSEFDLQECEEILKMLKEFQKSRVVPSLKALSVAAVGKRFSTSREVVKQLQPQDCPLTLIEDVKHFADHGCVKVRGHRNRTSNLAQHIISKLF